MPPVLFRCPNRGSKVQGWVSDSEAKEDAFISVHCVACGMTHYVNPKTGKRLGEDK